MKLIVIDAGVWIRLARSNFSRPITTRLTQYFLLPVVNNYLLSEIHNALIKNNWATLKQADLFVDYVKEFCLYVAERPVFRLSPDPKDNYLIDLAVQHNCAFIISDDTELLAIPLLPIHIKSCNWFLKHFPL
jgi:predicted nucleic acid-binding protein